VQYLNSKLGGIKGHPVSIVPCDEGEGSPTLAAACTPKFISSGVVGVIGLPIVWGDIGGPQAAAAKGIGFYGWPDVTSLKSPDSYPIIGYPAPGTINVAKQNGIKSVALVGYNNPIAVQLNKARGQLYQSNGIDVTKVLDVAFGQPDLATPTSQLLQGNPQAIDASYDTPDLQRALPLIEQSGFKGKLFVSATATSPGQAEKLGAPKGMMADTWNLLATSDTTDPEVVAFQAQMAAIGQASKADIYAATAFTQLLTLANIANGISGDVTPASLLDAFKNASNEPVFMGYVLNKSSALPGQPQVYNGYSRVAQWNGSTWQYVTGWVSPVVGAKAADQSLGAGSSEQVVPVS
jgi:branched-chain amino acid transport system substrate-binding protein